MEISNAPSNAYSNAPSNAPAANGAPNSAPAETAITGIGIISPLGCSAEEVLCALKRGEDGIAEASKIDMSKFSSRLLAEVKGFNPALRMEEGELRTFTDPFIRMAICAARAALEDSGAKLAGRRSALVLASCNAGLNSGEAEYVKEYENPSVRFDWSVCLQSEYYALPKAAAKCLNFDGPCYMINTACSGSTAAIGLAQTLVESGDFDAVLVGGADAAAISNCAGFNAIRVVSPEKIAPFSLPAGMNIGEGAAFWTVENLRCALARGAKIYGKVIGHSTAGDAHHPTQPDPRGDGAFRTMRAAAQDAGLSPSQIGCINAHGSGTAANDRAEAKAIARFCGEHKVPVTSTKSYMGHCMGATGILEATCQLLSMNEGFIPPTLRYTLPRPGCDISVVSKPEKKSYSCFLSANYAFAGSNAAIVVASRDFKNSRPAFSKVPVVVSGVSAVSALGTETDAQIEALRNSARAIRPASRLKSDRLAGLIDLPNPRKIDRRIDFSGMNNISSYAAIAAKRALDDASYAVGRGNSESVGIAMAVCRASSNEKHMEAVFGTPDRRGDIGCFSNVTANSTAGWVSKALEIKGANTTLTSGLNAGLQTLEYARALLRENRAAACLAMAADEVYARQLKAYEKLGALWGFENPSDFRLRADSDFKTLLGEGAAALLLETEESARARNAKIYGEISAAASAMDIDEFAAPNLASRGLMNAVEAALGEAKLNASDIDLVVWAPRGDSQDGKILSLLNGLFRNAAAVASTFNTGYVETSSALMTLAYALKCAEKKIPMWRQITGDDLIDRAPLPDDPKRILCAVSAHSGNSHAVIISR